MSDISMKIFFAISDMVQVFKLDSTKIDAYVEHKFFNYTPEGERTIQETRYNLRPCVD